MRRLKSWRASLRDPYVSSQLAAGGLGLAGVAGIVLGAAGAANQPTLDAQLPFVASGGLGGFALVIVAAGLYATQRRRLAGARRRAQLNRVLQAAAAVPSRRKSR